MDDSRGEDSLSDLRRPSAVLRDFVRDTAGDRVSLGDLKEALADRAYGVLILVLALPNLAPVNLPGLSAIFGIPLALLALQLTLGHPAPYFPRWIARRSFARPDLEKALGWGLPFLERVEAILRPRLPQLLGTAGERALGVTGIVLALTLALPIPFGNWLPSLALCLLALSLIERDGLAYLLGMVVAVAGVAVVAAVIATVGGPALAFIAGAVG